MDRACFHWNSELVSGKATSLFPEKPRACFRRSRRPRIGGSVCCAGGGGKCLGFAAKWFTFPEKTVKRAVESIFSRGKCLGFAVIWFTFREEQTRNGRSGYG